MKIEINNENQHVPVNKSITQDNEYEVASQWKLMWWKFKKHKLAIISAPVLTLLIIIAAFAEFLSPHLPMERFAEYKHAPPTTLQFIHPDTGFSLRPFVYGMTEEMNQETFRRTFTNDAEKTYPLHFFVKGEEYKFWVYSKLVLILSD